MTLPTTASLDAARQELALLIDDARVAWTAYTLQVESENRVQVDLAVTDKPYLAWEIRWHSGHQVSLGHSPIKRQFGQLLVAAKCKEGSGTSGCLKLLEHVMSFIEGQGTICTIQTAALFHGNTVQGIYTLPASFPFWIDSIVV